MTELMTTASICEVHRRHTPHPHLNHIHHVWPLGMGGPDIATNRIVVCPTGHYNIHFFLNKLLAEGGTVPSSFARTFSRQERNYAQIGYQRVIQRHM